MTCAEHLERRTQVTDEFMQLVRDLNESHGELLDVLDAADLQPKAGRGAKLAQVPAMLAKHREVVDRGRKYFARFF